MHALNEIAFTSIILLTPVQVKKKKKSSRGNQIEIVLQFGSSDPLNEQIILCYCPYFYILS